MLPVVTVVLAVACSVPGGDPAPAVETVAAAPPDTLPKSEDERRGGPPVELTDCGSDRSGIVATIAAQLDDFAAGDFAAALQHATPGFRETFSAVAFERLITEDFPIVAGNTGHVVGECLIGPEQATAEVEVVGGDGSQTLVYVLREVDDAWLIEGAFPLVGDGAQTA